MTLISDYIMVSNYPPFNVNTYLFQCVGLADNCCEYQMKYHTILKCFFNTCYQWGNIRCFYFHYKHFIFSVLCPFVHISCMIIIRLNVCEKYFIFTTVFKTIAYNHMIEIIFNVKCKFNFLSINLHKSIQVTSI